MKRVVVVVVDDGTKEWFENAHVETTLIQNVAHMLYVYSSNKGDKDSKLLAEFCKWKYWRVVEE